jgi:hypothetical protein
LAKNGLGSILGDFFTNKSDHLGSQTHRQVPSSDLWKAVIPIFIAFMRLYICTYICRDEWKATEGSFLKEG